MRSPLLPAWVERLVRSASMSSTWAVAQSNLLGQLSFAVESLQELALGAELDEIEGRINDLIAAIEEANEAQMSEQEEEEEEDEEDEEEE